MSLSTFLNMLPKTLSAIQLHKKDKASNVSPIYPAHITEKPPVLSRSPSLPNIFRRCLPTFRANAEPHHKPGDVIFSSDLATHFEKLNFRLESHEFSVN